MSRLIEPYQLLTDFPNPTEKSRWIFQLNNSDPDFFERHQKAIVDSAGFWAASPATPSQKTIFDQLLADCDPLNLHWRWTLRELVNHRAYRRLHPAEQAVMRDALVRYRTYHGAAVPGPVLRFVRRRFPLLGIEGEWNTCPPGRWRRACEQEALRHYNHSFAVADYTEQVIEAKRTRLAFREAQLASYSGPELHRIANAQIARDGINAQEWADRADRKAREDGLRSRFDYDNAKIERRNAQHLASQVRADTRALNAMTRRLRTAANKAQRAGDTAKAQALRRQAADIRRTTIDPSTGETIVTHQPPTHRPSHLRGTHGGARAGSGGRRPGAGRKRIFAATPPEPDPTVTAHADPTVSLARRWSHHAAWLAQHFSYYAKTGEVVGPSGQALDLRHPVSTPLGALRPGLLLAALLHGTVTRRYSLPRGTGAASTWPLHTLTATVVDAERDAGAAQPGTPAHLLVPPAPSVRRGGGR